MRRGRVAYLALTPAQKRALRDPEGQDRARRAPPPARSSTDDPETLPAGPRRLSRRSRAGSDTSSVRSVVGAWCGGCAKTGVVGLRGQYRQPYRNSAVRSGFCVRLYRLGRRLRASRLGEAKASCRQAHACQEGFSGSMVAAPALRRPSGPPAAPDTCRTAARDEDTRRGFPVAAMRAAQTRATADAWGTFQAVNASRREPFGGQTTRESASDRRGLLQRGASCTARRPSSLEPSQTSGDWQ